MTKDRLQKARRISVIAFVLCAANCSRYLNNSSLRTVELISFIALGMAFGAVITSIVAASMARRSDTIGQP